jgi:hypothetical protein
MQEQASRNLADSRDELTSVALCLCEIQDDNAKKPFRFEWA